MHLLLHLVMYRSMYFIKLLPCCPFALICIIGHLHLVLWAFVGDFLVQNGKFFRWSSNVRSKPTQFSVFLEPVGVAIGENVSDMLHLCDIQ